MLKPSTRLIVKLSRRFKAILPVENILHVVPQFSMEVAVNISRIKAKKKMAMK